MANGGRINYTIGFNVDKTGLTELRNQLMDLSKTTPTDLFNMNPGKFKDIKSEAQSALYYIKQDLKKVQVAFDEAFDPTTGLMNLQKLNVSLNNIGAKELSKSFSMLGQKGQDAFYQMTKSALTTNMQLKQTNTLLDKMGTTLMNTLKWTVSSGLINRIVGSFQQAYGYVQHLDSSLNDIRIVTKKSADEMDNFAVSANKAAQALGKTTTDYTEASLIYYQQGLSDEEVKARAETTLKVANVTGQATKAVSEELTAVWNGYKVNAEEAEVYVDKLAAVAATTASNLEELSTGMSKVASAAANMGVDIDQLNAMLSTVISVTRQAPETAGTAYKTIFARISDLKLGDTDEDGLKLGDVSSGLQKLGIEILDSKGELRDLGLVIEEVGNKWKTWTSAQQAAIAQLMAGKRQYNNLVALFSNWDMYEKSINTSKNATGELQKQQDIYMESTEAHLQQLKTEWEDLYDSIFDEKTINSLVDGITKVVNILSNFVDGIGGGNNMLLLLGSTALRVFDKQIGRGIANTIQSFQRARNNAQQLKAQLDNIEFFKQTQQYKDNPAITTLIDAQSQASKYYQILNNEQINEANRLVAEVADAEKLNQEWLKNVDALNQYIRAKGQIGKDKIPTNNFDFIKSSQNGSQKVDKAIRQSIEADTKALKDFTNNLKDAKEKYDAFLDAGGTKAKAKNELQDLRDTGKELQNTFEALKKGGLLNNLDIDQLQKIEQAFNNLQNMNAKGVKNAFEFLKQALQELPAEAQAALGIIEATFNQGIIDPVEKAKAKLNEFLDAASLQNFTTNLVNSIGAVGQFAGSINALSNSFEVLGDESTSAGEKILRLISSIGMGLPMLISSIGRIRASISGEGGIIDGLTGIILKHRGVTTATQNFAAAQVSAARTAKIALGAVSATITGLIIGITALVSHYQKIRQEAIEHNQTIIKEVNSQQELIDKNKELAQSLQDLIDKYKDGTVAEKDFIEQKKELIALMDKEQRSNLNTAKSWEDAQKALDEYNKKQAEIQKEEQRRKRNAALELGFDAMSEGYGSYDEEEHTFNYAKSMGTKNISLFSDRDLQYIEALEKAGFLNSREGEQINERAYELNFKLTADEEGYQQLKQLQKIQEEYAGQISSEANNIYKNINYQFNELKSGEGYQDLLDSLDSIKEADLQIAIADSQVNLKDNVDGLKEAQITFTEQLLASGYTTDEAMTAWIKTLGESTGKAQAEYQQRLLDLETMTQGYFSAFQGDITSTKKYIQIEKIYDELLGKGFSTEQIRGLGTDTWKDILTKGLDENTVNEVAELIAQKENESIEAAKLKIAESLGTTSDSIGKTISDAISGSIDVSSDEFKELLTQLEEIKKVYPELTNEVETFTETGLIGSERWIQNAYQLQSALDKLEFDNLNQKIDESREKLDNLLDSKQTKYDENGFEITLEVDDKEFQETMQEIMDAQYQIDVEVHSDAERDFDQLINSLEKADEMASKIGEDFIVAADDIRDLNNAFPGILEGIEYLGDGTIRLNEEIVQSAMAAASEQEAASTQELTTKLQNAATELRAKAEVYDSMADIAYQAAQGEIDEDTYQTQVSQKLDELEVENDKIASQTEMDNAVAVADNSNENAKISAENWTKSYQQAAQASYEFANTAIQNAASAAAGGGPLRQGNFSFTYSGSSGSTSSEAKSATGFKNVTDFKSQAANDEAKYRSMADEARQAANDIEGMMAGAAAKATEVLKNNQAAAGGRKSSSGSGGGGGGKDADHMDYIEREEDIYRLINEELEQIESTLGRIQKIQSHKWGVDYQKTLEKENNLLNQQVDKLKEKQKLQIGDLSVRRKQLEDVGVKFSEDGSAMLNAEQILNDMYANYNSMVDEYNNMSASAQEAYKAQLETEKNRMDAIEAKMDEYESTYSDLQSTMDELLDKHYEIIENNINQFNNKVNVQLELNDARKEWDEFWSDVVEDVDDTDFGGQIAKSLKQLKTLVGLNGDVAESSVKVLTDHVMNNVDQVYALIASADRGGEDSLFGDATKEAKENLMDYRSQLMNALKESKENLDDIADSYLKELQSAQDLIDGQVEGWDSIEKHLEHNLEMIKLIDGEKAFSAIGKQYEEMYKNNLNLLTTEKESKDYWAERVKHYQTMVNSAEEGTKEWKTYSEALEESVKQYRAAVEDLDAAVEKSIKLLQEERENLNNATFDSLDKALSGGLGLEALEDEWKLIDDYSSKYYDNVERYLNMEEYTNYLNDAANAI